MVRIRPLVAAAIAAVPMAVVFTATSADAHGNRHGGYYSQQRYSGNYHRSWRNSRWFAVRRHGNRHR